MNPVELVADEPSSSPGGSLYEAVVVGAGPAGLSAAISLGRARRRALLIDGGAPRNASSAAVHGFLSREGSPPAELLELARGQLTPLTTVALHRGKVHDIRGDVGRFVVELDTGLCVAAQRVLICVGIETDIPDLPGCRDLWGQSVFECPYCHGFEHRNGALGYLAPDADSLDFALLLRAWSGAVHVFTNGIFEPPLEARNRLRARGITIENGPIRGLRAGTSHQLEHVELQDGSRIMCQAFFVEPRKRQSPLVARLGLALDAHGNVQVNDGQETSRPGISAAGDLTTRAHLVVTAAAAGTVAGNTIVERLMVTAR